MGWNVFNISFFSKVTHAQHNFSILRLLEVNIFSNLIEKNKSLDYFFAPGAAFFNTYDWVNQIIVCVALSDELLVKNSWKLLTHFKKLFDINFWRRVNNCRERLVHIFGGSSDEKKHVWVKKNYWWKKRLGVDLTRITIEFETYPNFAICVSLPLTWSHIVETTSYTGTKFSSLIRVSHQILALTSLPASKCLQMSSFFLAMPDSFLLLWILMRAYDCRSIAPHFTLLNEAPIRKI